VKALAAGGFVFSATRLKGLAEALRASGSNEAADQLKTLVEIRNDGPCADDRPR
jgi:hypothetical protein